MLKGLIERLQSESVEVCRVLDIGGTQEFWATWADVFDWSRLDVTCVNIDVTEEVAVSDRLRLAHGDARALPRYADGAFDVVFSNSVIEHVGMWRDMEAMAREVRRLAPCYMIQTPCYWFPIEPHFRFPIIHWLPEPLGYRMLMLRRSAFSGRKKTVPDAVSALQSARLLDAAQMRALFPDAVVHLERFLLLTKSLIAVKAPVAPAA